MRSAENPFVVMPAIAEPARLTQPASFGRRSAALAIDLFSVPLCWVPGFVYLQALAHLDQVKPETLPEGAPADVFAEAVMRAIPVFVVGVFAWAVVQFGLLAFRRRSLGKHLLGLTIVRSDGTRVGVFRLLLVRTPLQVLSFAPFFGQMLLVINLVLALRPPHKALHDRMADTQVVVNTLGG